MNEQSNEILRVNHLTKEFWSDHVCVVNAVKNVQLEVGRGEIILICGPSGSGKTTLLSMIGCLLKPTSGNISVMGKDVTTLSQSELSKFRLRHIGFVFQTFRLLEFLTVYENLELVLNLSGIDWRECNDRIGTILSDIGIFHKASFYPGKLSGGEKQRAAIARALISNPNLILADEPTGSLDSISGKKIIEVLCKTSESMNKTVVIVSHDLRIRQYADRIIYMEDGHLAEEGDNVSVSQTNLTCYA